MSIVKLNNRSVKDITSFGSISSLGSLTHIATQTASSSASLSFTSGIDSTYKEYIFYFVNMHPVTDNVDFRFQANRVSGSGYNETITSTNFQAYHEENGSSAVLQYRADYDQAQGTAFQLLGNTCGNGNDESISGYLHIFNPSSTTFVKHFIGQGVRYSANDQASNEFAAGYINTTTALTRVRFKFNSGNIDAGDICLYGIN